MSVDPAEGEKGQIAFARELGVEFPFIPDTGRNLSILYGAASLPTQLSARLSILIDKDGIVRYIDNQIGVRTHGPDMLSRMRELGMIKPEAVMTAG